MFRKPAGLDAAKHGHDEGKKSAARAEASLKIIAPLLPSDTPRNVTQIVPIMRRRQHLVPPRLPALPLGKQQLATSRFWTSALLELQFSSATGPRLISSPRLCGTPSTATMAPSQGSWRRWRRSRKVYGTWCGACWCKCRIACGSMCSTGVSATLDQVVTTSSLSWTPLRRRSFLTIWRLGFQWSMPPRTWKSTAPSATLPRSTWGERCEQHCAAARNATS